MVCDFASIFSLPAQILDIPNLWLHFIIFIADILHQVADDDGYGGLSSYTSKSYEGYVSTDLATCAASTMLVFLYFLSSLIRNYNSFCQISMARHVPRVEMTIPASALSKVMGKRGTNLENIRKVSLYCYLVIGLLFERRHVTTSNPGLIIADNYIPFFSL